PSNWELRSIVCNDGNSTGSTGTATATYEIAEGESVTCTFTNCILQLDLASRTVTGTEIQVACDEITAGNGFQVASTGSLTLRARNRVVLTDGFSVAEGGALTVEIDSAL
ncbi:MAG: hypothetical protein R3324_20595, partial [Halobacteriales archaeon]|nr:hypothetical protein [Halobacteriales archaeon]